MVENSPANAGDMGDVGSIPELGRSPAEGNSNPLQYSCQGKFHGQRILAGYGRLGCSVQGLGPDLVSELAGKAGGLKSCFSGSGEPQRHFLSSL